MDNHPSNGWGPEVLLGLGRLEGRVEQFLTHQARMDEKLDEHDKRILALEETRSTHKGFATGIALIASAATAAVGFFVNALALGNHIK